MPARAGIGLRARHHRQVLEQRPACAWFEVHSENFFADGGPGVEALMRIRADYPLSLHGVGLSLGSTDPLDASHLRKLRRAVERFEPGLVSEHLAWVSVAGRFANDLLPLPYTEEALAHVVGRIVQVQECLGREILIENVSSYLEFGASRVAEWDFLAAVAARARCGILLDVNNVYVAANNHRFDPLGYLRALPRDAVREFHLAGHTRVDSSALQLLIDSHDAPVCEDVWRLFAVAVQRFGRLPTLIEWDNEIPAFDVLQGEAARADAILETYAAVAA